ncbi:MAG: YggU family protein [Gammaproteobacteria bacterium]|nr:YggU family protein [Gammaproteobacteria bacterium]
MATWYGWQGSNLLLNVNVQPRARQDEICGVQGDALKIRITAPPVDGKANAYLIAFVAEQCALNKSAVSVISGSSSRRKKLRLQLQKPNLPEVLRAFC